MNPFKRYFLIKMLFTFFFGVAFGVFFLLMTPYASEVFDILVIAMGLLTAVLNLPDLMLSVLHIRERGAWVNLLLAAGAVALGVALMFLQRTLLLVLLGIYSVLFPLLRIFLVSAHRKQLVRELPVMVSGIVMIVIFLTGSERVVLRIFSYGCFALALIYLIYGFCRLHFRFGTTKEKRSVIEGEFEEKNQEDR